MQYNIKLKFNTNRSSSDTARFLEDVLKMFNNSLDKNNVVKYSEYFSDINVLLKDEGAEVEMTYADEAKLKDFNMYVFWKTLLYSKAAKVFFEKESPNIRLKTAKFTVSIAEIVSEEDSQSKVYHDASLTALEQAETEEDFYRIFTQETTKA